MKLRTAIWIIAILCCIGLGAWQSENLSIIWREYASLHRHFEYEDHILKPRKPLIEKRVAQADPEAAAIAEIILCHYEDDEKISALAGNLLKYPDNKLFLYNLANYLPQDETVIDPQITLALSNKLLELEPDNANYHYLKAHALLMDRTGNDIDAVLEEIEYANKCPRNDFPYNYYRERTINMANEAKLSRLWAQALRWMGHWRVFKYNLRRKLLEQVHAEYTDRKYTHGRRICDTLNEMLKRELATGPRWSLSPFGYWRCPQQLELQRAELSKERARQNRLELCALAMVTKERKEKEKHDKQAYKELSEASILAVPLAVHSGKMVVSLASVALMLFITSTGGGFPKKTGVRFGEVVLFICSCVYYLLITQGPALQTLLDYGCCPCRSYIEFLKSPPIGLEHIIDEPVIASVFLAGPIITALALWGLAFLRPRKAALWKLWHIKALLSLGIAGLLTGLA